MKFLLPIIFFLSIRCGAQVIIKYPSYTIVFDTTRHIPIYTFYTLTSKESKLDSFPRTPFHMDQKIPLRWQSNPGDYSKSGYDKGHLAPDDDFRFDQDDESSVMVYTNCAPQNATFNRGIWRCIEDYARFCAENDDSATVYTGVVPSKQFLGKTCIPSHYWKAIKHRDKWDYFLAENRIYSTKNIFDLRVTRDSLVRVIGKKIKLPK